jgi:hypothetical protein
LLVLWCAGDRCGMVDSDEDHGRSRRPGAEDRGWSSTGWVLVGWMIERSGDAVCGLHDVASKPMSTISPSLASKPVALGFLVWASKPAAMVW